MANKKKENRTENSEIIVKKRCMDLVAKKKKKKEKHVLTFSRTVELCQFPRTKVLSLFQPLHDVETSLERKIQDSGQLKWKLRGSKKKMRPS